MYTIASKLRNTIRIRKKKGFSDDRKQEKILREISPSYYFSSGMPDDRLS